ncbi:MAG: M55 family metallopeptidase [Clostridia bacterium]|nr:M55 family metallopeptidase [Clostridia bacterium]
MKNIKGDPAILILSDMEGVSGLVDGRLVSSGNMYWREYGRYLLTNDVNTVAIACVANGFKKVLLSESHNFGMNTVYDSLAPFITVLPPHSAQSNLKGTEIWDTIYKGNNIVAAIMVGVHPMEGTKGFFPHSWDSKVFKNIKINGEPHGEIGTIAALLGYYDIPLICVVGDSEAGKEAEACIPGIKAISVKEQEADGWVRVLPPAKAEKLIYTEVSKCLQEIDKIQPLKLGTPVEISFDLKNKEKASLFANDPRVQVSGDTVIINADNYKDAYAIFWDCYVKIMLAV